MMTRQFTLAILTFAGAMPAVAPTAQAQIFDRLKQAAEEVISEETVREVDSRFGDFLSQNVADGGFMAALTPWLAADGSGQIGHVLLSGWTIVTGTGSEFVVLLCDEAYPGTWATRLTFRGQPASAVAPQRVREYTLPSDLVAVEVIDPAARIYGEARGSLRLATETEGPWDVWAGRATLTLPAVTLPGQSDQRSVQLAVTFRAQVIEDGMPRPVCSGVSAPDAPAAPTRTTQVHLSGITFVDLQHVVSALEAVEGVGEIHKSLTGSVGRLQVRHTGTSEDLARVLMGLQRPSLEIVGFSENGLQARVTE